MLGTDTAEPMAAAAVAAFGLAIAARAGSRVGAGTPSVIAAALIIIMAALLYEGELLALGFLPALVGFAPV